jgi:hypothetical protein
MKRLSGTAYVLIVIMAIMPMFVVFSTQLAYFASKILPVTFSCLVFLLAGIALVRDVRNTSKTKVASARGISAESKTRHTDKFRDYLPFAGWMISFSLGIYLLGFAIAIALFTGAYMKRHGSSWWGALITAVLFAATIHIVFDILLQSGLYKGLIPLQFEMNF